jgi:glycerol-3-phosphate dehydrogenase subunit B
VSSGPGRPHVVVVGAGIAGTGAAIAAAWSGARVTVVDGGAGATSLATGALDVGPWPGPGDVTSLPGAPLPEMAARVLDALEGFIVPGWTPRLLTTAGVVRHAAGHDDALLDVGPLAGRPIAVARCLREGWNADVLARAWGEPFVALDVRALRHADERAIPDADFAARHDDDGRLGWLELRVREALASAPAGPAFAGIVLPPSLGVDRPRARELSRRLGLACGEPVATPGGPSGLRFERARDRAFAASGVERLAARVASVAAREGRAWRVTREEGEPIDADAVVLAIGGVLGGGIAYVPPEDRLPGGSTGVGAGASRPRPALRASIEGPLTLGARGRPLEIAGSLFGLSPGDGSPGDLALPFAAGRLLERAGALVDDEGRCVRAPGGLFAAGDFVADAPRSWLRALVLGARAGLGAATAARAGAPGPGSPSPP